MNRVHASSHSCISNSGRLAILEVSLTTLRSTTYPPSIRSEHMVHPSACRSHPTRRAATTSTLEGSTWTCLSGGDGVRPRMGSLQPADERTSTSAAASTSRSGQSDAGSANIDGNFYECLGLRTQASEREIKQAYRVHARLWHPDTNTQEGAEVAFQKIKMAHEVLTDEELREDYDLNLNMGVLKGGSKRVPSIGGIHSHGRSRGAPSTEGIHFHGRVNSRVVMGGPGGGCGGFLGRAGGPGKAGDPGKAGGAGYVSQGPGKGPWGGPGKGP